MCVCVCSFECRLATACSTVEIEFGWMMTLRWSVSTHALTTPRSHCLHCTISPCSIRAAFVLRHLPSLPPSCSWSDNLQWSEADRRVGQLLAESDIWLLTQNEPARCVDGRAVMDGGTIDDSLYADTH